MVLCVKTERNRMAGCFCSWACMGGVCAIFFVDLFLFFLFFLFNTCGFITFIERCACIAASLINNEKDYPGVIFLKILACECK